MSSSSFDHILKLLLVGSSGVGKTSVLLAFVADDFDPETRSTIGVDLKVKMMTANGSRCKLTIWDTAGQERFRTLTSAYYRGAHGVVIMYDVTRRKTFSEVTEWLNEVDIFSTKDNVVKLLVANKCDLEEDRVVSKEEGVSFAREHQMVYIETSARTKMGVNRAFEELVFKILESPDLLEDTKTGATVGLGGAHADDDEQWACC